MKGACELCPHGHCDGNTRRGTQRALDIIELQRPGHVWVHIPSCSQPHRRHQKILNNLIWMLPEMHHRGCEVHIAYTSIVNEFESSGTIAKKNLTCKIESDGCA